MTNGKYIRTKEVKDKMRKSHLNKKLSEETRRKISEVHKGKIKSETHRKALSRALKGRHINPQTEFKKGQKAWNFEHGTKLKRKFKKWKNKLILKSHYVYCKYNSLDKIPNGYIIHHKDHNSLNDNIDNLILMKDSEHRKLHLRISKLKAGEKLI